MVLSMDGATSLHDLLEQLGSGAKPCHQVSKAFHESSCHIFLVVQLVPHSLQDFHVSFSSLCFRLAGYCVVMVSSS